MLKQIIIGTIAFTLSLSVNAPVFAQTPITIAQASEKVSQEDLEKFANALVQIKVIEQQVLVGIIQQFKNRGFSQERFEAIVQAQQSQTPLEPELTEEEKTKLAEINSQIRGIRQQATSQMEQAVQTQNLNIEQYRKILAMVRQNPELKEKVEQIVVKIVDELRTN